METASVRVRRKTTAEKMRALRKERKEKDPSFQIRENARISALRKRQRESMNDDQLKQHRKKVAKHVRLFRLRKKLKQQENIGSLPVESGRGFKTPQTLGKAVRKLDSNLPKSPSKQRAAVASLVKRVGLELDTRIKTNPAQSMKWVIADETEKRIKDFYLNTDIVYTMPGMNDELTVWENGVKSKIRKYYLIMFLKEVYELFKQCHSDVRVGFSKFASLRPVNVLLLKDQHPDQCKCETHENFMLKIKGLGLTYDENFWPSILCNHSSDLASPCWRGICNECQVGSNLTMKKADADTIFWKQWVKTETGHLRLDQKQGCVGQLKEELYETFPHFQEHVRIKRIQSEAFEKDKKRVDCHVLQIDFAMAYSCQYQNEIQSALWSRSSVNLFTAALYSKSQGCQPFLIVTDSQEKGKNCVFTFINVLSDYFKFETGDELTIYSDGPSSEFKNRYMVKLVSMLCAKLKGKVSWKYFATSHGKGVVDGIGGSAKSLVRKRVMSKGENAVVVQTSMDFYQVAKDNMKEVTVLHISETEIFEFVNAYKPWENVKYAVGISKMHIVSSIDGSTIEMFKTNLSEQPSSTIVY